MRVIKPFTTALRRLQAGNTVSETDEIAPHTIASLKASGHLSDTEQKKPRDKAAKPLRRRA